VEETSYTDTLIQNKEVMKQFRNDFMLCLINH